MNEYFVRLTEFERGKKYPKYAVVAAYKSQQAKDKLDRYYKEALRGMGITYTLHSITKVDYDIGDIAWLSRRMIPK